MVGVIPRFNVVDVVEVQDPEVWWRCHFGRLVIVTEKLFAGDAVIGDCSSVKMDKFDFGG